MKVSFQVVLLLCIVSSCSPSVIVSVSFFHILDYVRGKVFLMVTQHTSSDSHVSHCDHLTKDVFISHGSQK